MGKFNVLRAAQNDLLAIGRYTEERWGREQRNAYLAALDWRFRAVARTPSLGKSCDDIRPGLRRIGQGRHVVYFRQVADVVEIVRVLHVRMLPAKHLI